MPFIIIAAVILLDQLTKNIVVTYLQPVTSVPIIDKILYFTYHENSGAFMGMFSDARWVFMITSSVALLAMIGYIIYSRKKQKPALLIISLAMMAGGGIGNMIDRIALKYVIDFIEFRVINFPIFNIADSFITIGAALFIIYYVKYEITVSEKHPAITSEDYDKPVNNKNNEQALSEKGDKNER